MPIWRKILLELERLAGDFDGVGRRYLDKLYSYIYQGAASTVFDTTTGNLMRESPLPIEGITQKKEWLARNCWPG